MSKEPDHRFILESLNIKEICDKYKDKVVRVDVEGDKPVIIMDTCRIKYTGLMKDYYDW